jgi:ATP-dependent helicase/nuclease subunit A
MSSPRVIPDAVRKVQIAASDPAVSAWVSANAGSGKTHVLAQRVIRLLLDGVDPAKILCITFTKAAAALMANRVFGTLGTWTTFDDAALDQAMGGMGAKAIGAQQRALARQLFARTLETPGGLKVQTIHAFCTSLLHQFPFEANVAARFSVLDEPAERQLLEQLVLGVLLEAAGKPNEALGRALAVAITTAADQTFKDVVNEAIGERDLITAWVENAGGVQAAAVQLAHALGLNPDDTRDKVEAAFFAETLIADSEWPAVAAALAEGSKTDAEQGGRFAALATARSVDDYLCIFCTTDLAPRKNIVTKAIQNKHPSLFQRLLAEQERVCALLDRRRAIICRDRSAALLTIAAEVIKRYQNEKDRRGLLDYDDLIDKTLKMLRTGGNATWVHYKLDLGIDHLLIDEAQDTSPKQWDVIESLSAEFFAGHGARGRRKRTIFAVGDEKQSIFSFQGAAPVKFSEMRAHFEKSHKQVELGFVTQEFKHSFRSGENVLGAVDAVFAERTISRSVTSDQDGIPPHIALPDAAPGVVEIWELLTPDQKREMEAWDAPFDETTETSPRVRLACKIAKTAQAWLAGGRFRPGDILVLVRQRGPLFEAIIRAIKSADISVAGADRLVLTEHIAVMDLLVLADALLLPDDDLALATVLKSPLFGFSEEQLFELAWQRRGSLRASLRRKGGQDLLFAAAAARLDQLTEAARRQTPFDFYARLLGAEGGRKQMLARLGVEAADALDEFLNLALDYERRETPSLQGFVSWLRTAQTDVKRDMEIVRDEVRVMTVHGAKGLEAPIVILADTTTQPTGPRPPRLLALPAGNAAPGTPDRLVWAAAKATDVAPVGIARERANEEAENEYRRLLYVAMTRAAQKLIVCGARGERPAPARCWHELVSAALIPLSVQEPADDGDGTVWRYRKTPEGETDAAEARTAAVLHAPVLPDWLTREVVPEAAPARVLTPSGSHEDDAPVVADAAAAREQRQRALARGVLVHRLLQSLPDVPTERREDAARRHLARAAKTFDETERADIVKQVLAVIEDPRFAALFAGSRTEVPIVGRLAWAGGEPIPVSGQVDRLAVTAECIWIADYKSNRPPPRRLQDVPPAYVRQLALYRALLSRLYQRPVRAVLIWTEAPDLMEIPAAALDAALARVTSA